MEDLIKLLANKHRLSEAEAHDVLITISDYVKQKFPMLEGAINNLFQTHQSPFSPKTGNENQGDTDKNVTDVPDFLDI